jgi:hypothetical protein
MRMAGGASAASNLSAIAAPNHAQRPTVRRASRGLLWLRHLGEHVPAGPDNQRPGPLDRTSERELTGWTIGW